MASPRSCANRFLTVHHKKKSWTHKIHTCGECRVDLWRAFRRRPHRDFWLKASYVTVAIAISTPTRDAAMKSFIISRTSSMNIYLIVSTMLAQKFPCSLAESRQTWQINALMSLVHILLPFFFWVTAHMLHTNGSCRAMLEWGRRRQPAAFSLRGIFPISPSASACISRSTLVGTLSSLRGMCNEEREKKLKHDISFK